MTVGVRTPTRDSFESLAPGKYRLQAWSEPRREPLTNIRLEGSTGSQRALECDEVVPADGLAVRGCAVPADRFAGDASRSERSSAHDP